MQKETTLRESINLALIYNTLAQLIIVWNLLYNIVTWLKLQVLFLTVNYTYKEALIDSYIIVLIIIKESYIFDKELFK